jgi:chaperonin GroEL (HSP60 family)
MTNFEANLNDLKQIEKIILTSYGKNGRNTLIQSSWSSSSQNALLTNDCITILNSIKIEDNQLFKIVYESVKKFSRLNGDQCKTLYVFMLTSLGLILRNDNKHLSDMKTLKSELIKMSIGDFYEKFNQEWEACFEKDDFLKSSSNSLEAADNPDLILSYFESICVSRDLASFNRSLSRVSTRLIKEILVFYSKSESFLTQIEHDLDEILTYSDNSSLEESKVFQNGFLIETKSQILHLGPNLKCIFLYKSVIDTEKVEIELKNFDFKTDFTDKFYSNEKSNLCFSSRFIDELKKHEIGMVFVEGGLSEIKKAQLHNLGISCVTFLDKEFLEFLCVKLSIKSLDLVNDGPRIEAIKNVIEIEKIETVERDRVYFFKLKDNAPKIVYIRFCSPIKLNFNIFKMHFLKVLRTLRTLCEKNRSNLLLKAQIFDLYSLKLFRKMQHDAQNLDEKLLYTFFRQVFMQSYLKLNKIRLLDLNYDFYFDKNSDLLLIKEDAANLYEPFNLKTKMLVETLNVVKTVLRVSSIIYVKSVSFKGNKRDSDEERD